MPKRLNPFDEDICRQRKVHVGEKEISNGVLMTNKMKHVFDNTTDRLFEGTSMWYKSQSTAKRPHDTSKILTEHNQADDILCICGHYVKDIHVSRCDYCDKSLCFPCLKECKICKNLYCPSCSLEELS
ncbi:uncharacterized protein LOC142323251 isoform X2 [Lycorma delicatula]|uniref:uncharacterized protein LOC142323251 isoform X2 n=1 Tax=Lycorma delicatula TaxID=130591 RepID=UPI003F511204